MRSLSCSFARVASWRGVAQAADATRSCGRTEGHTGARRRSHTHRSRGRHATRRTRREGKCRRRIDDSEAEPDDDEDTGRRTSVSASARRSRGEEVPDEAAERRPWRPGHQEQEDIIYGQSNFQGGGSISLVAASFDMLSACAVIAPPRFQNASDRAVYAKSHRFLAVLHSAGRSLSSSARALVQNPSSAIEIDRLALRKLASSALCCFRARCFSARRRTSARSSGVRWPSTSGSPGKDCLRSYG